MEKIKSSRSASFAVIFAVYLAASALGIVVYRVLQGVSDVQMHVFRKKAHGGFIRTGLWKYSRHPNYLGEILMWWGMGLAVVSAMPQRWYLLAGAVLNTVMFLVVSIPMADKRRSAKPGFAEYKRSTRMLLPLKKFGTK